MYAGDEVYGDDVTSGDPGYHSESDHDEERAELKAHENGTCWPHCRHCAEGQCPACSKYAGFTERTATSHEPHGEVFEDRWLECNHCGAQLAPNEIKSLAIVLASSVLECFTLAMNSTKDITR